VRVEHAREDMVDFLFFHDSTLGSNFGEIGGR
jgi:hypothetical protein